MSERILNLILGAVYITALFIVVLDIFHWRPG